MTLDQKFGSWSLQAVFQLLSCLRNGSSVKVQIPRRCYKPKVYWRDGFVEVLYTLPTDGNSTPPSAASKGGIGLVFNDLSDPNSKGFLIKTSEWTVTDVDSDSIDALQGRELFFRFIRMGFEDIYLSSSGSFSQKVWEKLLYLYRPCFSAGSNCCEPW